MKTNNTTTARRVLSAGVAIAALDESARRYVVDQATNVIVWSRTGSVSNPAPAKEAGTRHGHH